jgi:DNA uptake protein ComE-like DNA-binding protein
MPSILGSLSSAIAADTTELLALNTVTADQLKALPGIGDAYSEKIIKGVHMSGKTNCWSRGLPRAT